MTSENMKAVILARYGSPAGLQLKEIPKPLPKVNEILIRVHATTVTPFDVGVRKGKFPIFYSLPMRIMFGLRHPRNLILGYELSGVVESVGRDVNRFKVGDEVFGATYRRMATYAEYICIPADFPLSLKPENMTFEQAAAIPDGASTALHFLNEANIQSGQKVLVYGASGSVGTYAVQLAKHFGCDVTAVCSSKNHHMIQELGADSVIDYNLEDYSESSTTYQAIFDAVGRSSFSQAKKVLAKDGIFLTTKFGLLAKFRSIWTSKFANQKLITGLSRSNFEKLTILKNLVEDGKIVPVIDRVYSLEEMEEAHQYVSRGHKKGNVVIRIQNRQ